MNKSCENCSHRGVCKHPPCMIRLIPAFMNWEVATKGIKETLAAGCPHYKYEEEVPK